MPAFLLRRTLALIGVLWTVVTLTFFMIRLTPGGPFDRERKIPASIEKELLKHRRFKSKAEARMALFEWIEGWNNPHRRHSSIGRLSPNNFERRLLARQEVRI